MVKIRQMLLSSAKYSVKSPYKMTPKFITIHNTANDASANNEASYHNSNNNQVSFHYAVDDKEIVQVLPDNRTAWHCGDGKGKGNMQSIGVEICYSKSGGSRYDKAEQQAVELTAHLLDKYSLPISAVKQHYEWSKKNCPHRIRANGTWNKFIARVKEALEALQTPVKAVKGISIVKAPYRVKSGSFGTRKDAESAKTKVGKNNIASEKYISVLEDGNGKFYFQTGTYADNLIAENALQKMKDLNIIKVGHVIKD